MKLSISNIAWGQELDEEMYKIISDSSFQGIEIAPTRIFEQNPYSNLDGAEEYQKLLNEKHGLQVCSMQSIWFGRNENIFSSQNEREALIAYTKKAIDFAKVLNCKNLVFGCPRNRNMPERTDIHLLDRFLKEIGDYAYENNTVFAVEPNPPIYNTNCINTTQTAFDLVKRINLPGLKVNYDFGTVIENKEDLDILANNIEWINHIHISEPYLAVVQKRNEHKKLAQILRENKYDKYVSIEMKKCEDMETLKNTIDYIREVFEC